MEHFSYVETLRRLAAANWGKTFNKKEEADKDMLKGELSLSDVAALDLINRLNNAVAAFGVASRKKEEPLRPPTSAKVFEVVKIGDVFWSGCLEDGFYREIVIGMDEEGHALTVTERGLDESDSAYVYWAGHGSYVSAVEAVKAQALSDIEYHGARLEYARKALAAAEAGNVDDFLQGSDL